MKTFTTYAEKKAKQFFNLLQGYTKGIRFTAMLMLLLVGTTNAWAYDIKCTFIYDNSKTNWSSVQLMVGHGSWSQGYVMTKIANTQLWYYTFSDTWGGATHICVFNASSAWDGEGNSVSHRSSYMDQNTEVKALSGNMTDGIQLITTTSGSDGTAMSTSYHSSYTGLNTTQTATVQSTTDGSNYSTNTNAGSVSISTYKLSSSTASTSSTGTTSASAARTATVTMTASAKTGYTWKGWYNSSGTRQTTSTTLTYSCSGSAATYYARFQANTYTVTLDKQSGTGGTSSVTATYGSAMPSITVPTRTGYTFGGYYTGQNGTGTQYYTSTGSSAKNWNKTSATTLHAKWTENTYTVTINNDGHGTTSPSGEQTVGQVTSTTITATPSTGYQFHSWTYSGGVVKVSESNTTEQGSITITATATGTVTANFEPIPETKYDVTISSAGNGSVDPSGTQQVGESGIDITATAANNYQFSHWTTTGGATVANANSANTTVTATNSGSVTAHFTEIMRNITVTCNANHGTVSPSSTTAGVVTASGTITATPKAGYEFTNWTASSGITLANDNSATTTITQATANGTVTAKFSERKHNVTVSYKYGDTSIKDNTTTSNVGEVTSTNITAPTIAGYTFSSWTLGTGITNKSANTTTNPISITTKSSGNYTLTANYEEDLSSTYYVEGDDAGPFTEGWNANENTMMKKRSGESTSKDVYWELEVPAGKVTPSETQWEFKIYNSAGTIDNTKWLGWGTDNNYYWLTKENNNLALSTSGSNNIRFKPYLVGTYTFHVNYDNPSSPTLEVIWPTLNQICFYSAQTGGSGTDTYEWDNTSSTTWTKTISLSKGTHYFKVLENSEYLGNTGTMTRGNCSGWTMSSTTENCGITADVAGDYLFSYNTSTNKLTVTYPTAYTVTYSHVPTAAADAPTTNPSITSGDYVAADTRVTFTAKTAKTGYTFKGWYDNNTGAGAALSTNLAYPRTINANTTIYAVYIENEYKVVAIANPAAYGTVTPETATTMSGSNGGDITATPRNGYKFDNWTIKSGTGYFGETGTNTTSTTANTKFRPTADSEVQANFSAITYTINYNLNGGTGTMTPTTYTIETTTFNLPTPTRDGYTFAGWFENSNLTGTAVTAISQGSTGNKNLYAKWTEITSTVTVTTANEAYGTLKFGSTAQDWGTTASVGVTTTQSITATANKGYKFVQWELSGSATSTSTLTDATINLNSDGTGTAGTATAVFEEDLSSNYVVRGGAKFGNTWGSNDNKMTKKPGHSTEDIVYFSVNIDATNTGDENDAFHFKIYDTKNQKWWGLHTDNCSSNWWYNRNSGEQTLTNHNTDKDNIQLRADAEGEYEIKVDYSNANNPKITVIFPSSKLSLVGTFNDWNVESNPFTIDGDIATATVNLNDGTYEFKINDEGTWRSMDATTRIVTRGSNQNINFNATSGSNTTLKADIDGTYTFIYNKSSQKLTVQYPDLTIRLTGEFNGWNNSDDNYKFTEDPAKPGTYTLTKPFDKRERWQAYGKEQAEYEFKLNINGKSYTVEGDGGAKVLQYTRQNTTKIVNDGTDYTEQPYYNLLLQADQNGDYLFTYDSYTRQLTVTHPKYYPEASYIVGDFSDNKPGTDAMPGNGNNSDEGHDWTETYGQELEDGVGCIELGKNSTWNFKIKINGIWYGADIDAITTSGTYTLDDEYADTGEKNVTINTTNEEGCYYFEYTLNNDGTLSVLIIFPNDRRTVTFNMQGHGTQVDEQHVLYNQTAVKPYVSDVAGYLFGGWYTDANCTAGTEYDFTKPVTQDITLYAKWIPYEDCIFFKNNLNWDEVYVYTFTDEVWHKGTDQNNPNDDMGVQPKENRNNFGKMTRIGLTDIYYYILQDLKGFNRIAFSDYDMSNYDYFHEHKAIYRSDRQSHMQLFIPQADQSYQSTNSTRYFSSGLWMKYNDTYSGYDWSGKTADTNWGNTQLKADIAGEYSFVAEVYLNVGTNYEFKIKNLNNDWYGNNGTMTAENCTNWHFETNLGNAKITPTVTGYYIFTVYLGDGKVMVSLEYPLVPGDYRLAYKDNTAGSFHPGHYIKKRNKDQNDTVSFFIHHDKEPQVIVQECTEIDVNGNETWATINEISVNPADGITETGVYNFVLQQIADESTPILLSQHSPYTGDYYIRTYAANGGWRTFRHKDNLMTYSSYADEHEDFDHYFCKWVDQEKGMKNVSYTVANNYSYCISDTLLEDIDPGHPLIVTNAEGDLPEGKSANVRFGWDSKTNKLRRAYIAGSGHKKDRFLVLQGNEHLTDINGKLYTGQTAPGQDRYNLKDNEVVLDDMGNWIYQMDVQANKDTEIKLTALYNDLVQYFKGTETVSVPLLSSTATKDYKIRLIYDFKTNHLVVAWLAGGETIEGEDQELGADMMIIRHNQDPAEQLNFDLNTRQLSKVGTAYAVMTFDKYFLNNKNPNTGNALATADEKSSNERMFYWISFPFDVKISDVFGFGEYGDYWIMEYYDGAERAAKGWWAETETFWKYITNKNYVLKAGQGYVLCLNLNKMGFASTVFANTAEVSLYFPSTGPLNTITGELPAAVDVPAHTCTIERDNRNIYDSHWNLIGVPGFANIEDVGIGEHLYKPNPLVQDSVSFYYEYIPATNKYHTQTQTETFQTMYSYMIQYTGTINWRTPAFSDPALMARRIGELPDQYTLRLVLHSGDKEEDQTFVQLQEERATADFDMNLDLAKMMNSGANIYTLTANTAIMVAGNAIPMEATTVPVGVQVATAGEYTFRMPDGTDGIAVTLVDNVTGTHTNMLMNEYTVTLDAGTIENRFYLVVDPDRTATSVENVGSGANGDEAKGQIKKFLIDGKLFIRTTDGIFDAKGQRL